MLRFAQSLLLILPCSWALAQEDFSIYRPPVFRTLDRSSIICDLRKLPEQLQIELSNAPFGHPERAYDYVRYKDARMDSAVQENGIIGLCILNRDVDGLGSEGVPVWIVRSLVQIHHLNYYLVNANNGSCLTTSFYLGPRYEQKPRNIDYKFIPSKTPTKSSEGTFDEKNKGRVSELYATPREAPSDEGGYRIFFDSENVQGFDEVRERLLKRLRESSEQHATIRIECIDFGQIVFVKEEDGGVWRDRKEWCNWVFLQQTKVGNEWFLDDVIFVNVHSGAEISMFNDIKRTSNLLE